MKKRVFASVLAVMLVISGSVIQVFAEDENVYYIEADATGNGTEENPGGDFGAAVASFGGEDGTIYVYGSFNMSGFKGDAWEGTVTVTGVSSDSVITIDKSQSIQLKGDTIIRDIGVSIGEFAHINTNGIDFVYDPGDDVDSGTNAILHLACGGNETYPESYVEYNSGTTSHVYACGGYTNSFAVGIEGDNTFVMNGGYIKTFYLSADSYMDSHTGISIGGNMNVIINGGSIRTFGVKKDAVAADILGSLNIIFNNGTAAPEKIDYPSTVAGGVYVIKSGEGGTIMPTSEQGVFEIKANDGMVAQINGETVYNGKATFEPGETSVNWYAGEQPDESIEVKLTIGKAEIVTNGEAKALDVPAQIIDSRTMVPLRAIFEALGATVEWDDATKTVTSEKDDTTVILTIASPVIIVNGKPVALDVPAQIVDSRTLVPVRAIAESFGCEVGWDDATKTVTIVSE